MSEQATADSNTAAVPVVLITGTSTGIGLASAIETARSGWKIVATMRDLKRAEALRAEARAAGVELDIRQLDVTDAGDIQREIAYCLNTYGGLDALVNNAGSAAVGTVEMMETTDFHNAMEVNFFGVVALTRAAMPLLRDSSGCVITVSSVGGVVGQPFNEAYCAAKFAVEGFLESLQPVARTVGVRVHLIEPGAVSSSFVENAGIDSGALLSAAGPYRPAISAYLERTSRQFASSSAQQPADVAEVVLSTLQDSSAAFRIQTSSWARDFVAAKLNDLDGSKVTGLTAGWVTTQQG
ncbi:SDR family NAD(P)-dependent oxidoreductase [Pseudarthrobacter sp902506025]|uniref:SDR family NAD(P)-dependent oxidoreductase n=1 Tax=Pseudarthrobacter sp. 902506025 TaxID=3155291 RepID=UPI00344C1613